MHLMKAIALLREIPSKINNTKGDSASLLMEEYNNALSDYIKSAGKPISAYEQFYIGEPPSSLKFSRILYRLESDLTILRAQGDNLVASTIQTHNTLTAELEKARNLNAKLSNKLTTLQLYSTARNEGISIFGDNFKNRDQIDDDLLTNSVAAALPYPGNLTLGREASNPNAVWDKVIIRVLPESNGFAGNNQELLPGSSEGVLWNDDGEEQPDYNFVSSIDPHSDLQAIIDNEPNTWFEYEHYQVSEEDREAALDLNFVYRTDSGSTNSKPTLGNLVDWSVGPGVKTEFERSEDGDGRVATRILSDDYGILKLGLEFEFEKSKKINSFTLDTYGLTENNNHPVYVSKVETSEDGTTWVNVQPEGVWIANTINLKTARLTDNTVLRKGVWLFEERYVKQIRVHMQQVNPINVTIGHAWWKSRERTTNITKTVESPEGSGTFITVKEVITEGGVREEGPIPSIEAPGKFHSAAYTVSGNFVRHIEAFSGRRWAIGIRDCSIEQVKYQTDSIMISKPFVIEGIIDRVSLEADVFTPESFDQNVEWVKFFVSPNDGLNWYQISRVQDDYNGVPEILAFNDPLPIEFREANVGYYNVEDISNKLRLKIELYRPGSEYSAGVVSEEYDHSTPIVRSYRLKVKKRI